MQKTTSQISNEVLLKCAEGLTPHEKMLRNTVGVIGAVPYASLGTPVIAGLTAPKGEGWSRAGGTLGWGILGGLPGAIPYVLGSRSGNVPMAVGGLAATLLGSGLGSAYGMQRAIEAEHEARRR